MKQFLLLSILAFAMSRVALSSPCASGTLASYIGLGAAGCTVGANTFFDFQTVPGTARATTISTGAVSLSPLGGSFNPGLSTTVNVSAAANSLLETIFTYQVSGQSYASDAITLGGASETGDGGVTYTQNYCFGGTFGPDGVTGCTGTAGALVTLDGVQNSASATVAQASLVSITDDLVLDGGTMGSASGAVATDQLAAVPEPGSIWLVGMAVLAFGCFKRLTLKCKESTN